MDLRGRLQPGLRIVGADRTEYGTVERYDDQNVYVGGRKLPYSAFERTDKDRAYILRTAHIIRIGRPASERAERVG